MGAAYSPQRHADALADWTELVKRQTLEIAALHGKVDRLLQRALPIANKGTDAALDNLVRAAFAALGSRTWVTAELLAYTLRNDPAALELAQAIAATGKTTTRSLGKYLAGSIVGAAYLSDAGLEIQRSGNDGNSLAWTIVRV